MRIVYNSFGGRYSDSPRMVHEALLSGAAGSRPLTHTWLAAPEHRSDFPAGTETVAPQGRDAMAALEAADLVFSNTHLGPEWRRAAGATYVQTWHGTPIKRIAADERWLLPGAPLPGGSDIARWDVLLSPNRASTPRLRGAFRYRGEVAETGLPRNDVLLEPGAPARREQVRERLGIEDGVVAVLYCPTFRDDVRDPRGGRGVDLQLDVRAFADRLGPGHVLLLRMHYWVAHRLAVPDVPGVLDVSGEPDVSDLYLASDAMVTDYSSAMVDFAVTGKPLVLFTYDLAHYRDELRGLYIDLEEVAPGPLVATTGELLDALADLPGVVREHRSRYARFREEYCHLDDGGATQRVVDRFVLGTAAATAPQQLELLGGAA